MAIHTDETIPYGGRLLIWHLTETEEQLLGFPENADNEGINAISGIKNPLRRKQKLAVRLLLSMLFNDGNTLLSYSTAGKPYLKGTKGTLSISGSANYVAVLHHTSAETGIDIEEKRDKIVPIAPKFANSMEYEWINPSAEKEDFHLIWGVKEAAFKLIGGGGIDFRNHLHVSRPEKTTTSAGRGIVLYNKHLPAIEIPYYYRYLEDYILVYTIAETNEARKASRDF
jgi:hypothetical protein